MTDGVGYLDRLAPDHTNGPENATEAIMSLDEIVDLLDRHGKRATYGAVARILGHSPRSLLKGRERGRRFSWIVNSGTGMPTGYPDDQIDPRLRESGPVMSNDGELRSWLENPT